MFLAMGLIKKQQSGQCSADAPSLIPRQGETFVWPESNRIRNLKRDS